MNVNSAHLILEKMTFIQVLFAALQFEWKRKPIILIFVSLKLTIYR